MTYPLWFWILLGLIWIVVAVMAFIDDKYLRYDIYINKDYFEGVNVKIHHFKHEIELINCESGVEKVIVIPYRCYYIKQTYYVFRRKKEDADT